MLKLKISLAEITGTEKDRSQVQRLPFQGYRFLNFAYNTLKKRHLKTFRFNYIPHIEFVIPIT